MNNVLKTGLMTAAIAGAMGAAIVTQSDTPANAADKVKCYGVAKAGQNDCGSADGAHSCAGQAKADNLPTEWKFKGKEECAEMGGHETSEAAAAAAAAE